MRIITIDNTRPPIRTLRSQLTSFRFMCMCAGFPPYQVILVIIMAPHKKSGSSSKKKTNGSSSSNNNNNNKPATAAPTNNHGSNPGFVISPDEAISKWLDGEELTAEGLSAALPDIAVLIKNGNIDLNKFKVILREARQKHMKESLKDFLPVESENQKIDHIYLGILQVMTPDAEPLLTSLVEMACGAYGDMIHAFALDFYGKKCKWTNVRDTIEWTKEDGIINLKDVDLIKEIHVAYYYTCNKFKADIESRMNCPLGDIVHSYTINFGQFVGCLEKIISSEENSSCDDLLFNLAFTEIINKGAQITSTFAGVKRTSAPLQEPTIHVNCWECGKMNATLLCCAQCKASRYCSKACQINAWKGGHRGACLELKDVNARFEENYRCIDAAVAKGCISDGCCLEAGETEYTLLLSQNFHQRRSFIESTAAFFDEDMVGVESLNNSPHPKIEHLHKSLAELYAGKRHWLFNDAFEGSLPTDYLLKPENMRAKRWETKAMRGVLHLLSLDCSQINPIILGRLKEEFWSGVNEVGGRMPVARFLAMYYQLGKRPEAHDPFTRLICLRKVVQNMIKHYHKVRPET